MISFCSRVEFVFAFRLASLSRKNSPFVSIRKFVNSAFHRIIFKEPLAHSLWSKREREKDEAEELLYAHTHKQTNERTNEREGNTFLRSARLSFFSIFEASREKCARWRSKISFCELERRWRSRARSFFFPVPSDSEKANERKRDDDRKVFRQTALRFFAVCGGSRSSSFALAPRLCWLLFFLLKVEGCYSVRMRKEERVDAQVNWENARLVARLWC